MNLQYISDNKGRKTGVFIPIDNWEYLKYKYKEIEQEEKDSFEVPEDTLPDLPTINRQFFIRIFGFQCPFSGVKLLLFQQYFFWIFYRK